MGSRLITRRVLLAAVLVLAAAGCSQQAAPTRQLTQRQRDSTLGASILPGAPAVTRALKESDRASAAAHQMDQQVQDAGDH